MNPSDIQRALFWKEIRQIAPLVCTLLLLGLGFDILIGIQYLVNGAFNQPGFALASLMAIPILFAVGCGAMLVGNEKDQHSLNWLRSLPIPASKIAWTKLLVAVGSLAVVWVVSILIFVVVCFLMTGKLGLRGNEWGPPGEASYRLALTYPLQSLFLLFVGIAAAWRMPSSVSALLAVIPICFAVWLLSELLAMGLSRFELISLDRDSFRGWVYSGVVVLATLIAGAYGWRESLRRLRPLPAPKTQTWMGNATAAGLRDSQWWLWHPQPALSALLWQTAVQSRWIWLSLSAILAVCIWLTATMPYDSELGDQAAQVAREVAKVEWLQGVVVLVGCLAFCWLGCFAFQGDNLQQRIRFLSDRGVSPTKVWWTRMWIPLTIVLLAGLLRCVLRPANTWGASQLPESIAFDALCFTAGALAIVVASQWFSQCVNSPILSAVISPLVVGSLFFYGLFAHFYLGAPIWLLALALGLLLLATWTLMKSWMDRAIGRRYFLHHALFLMSALALTTLPCLWQLANLPRMPADVRVGLQRALNLETSKATLSKVNDHKRNGGFWQASTLLGAKKAFENNEALRTRFLDSLRTPNVQSDALGTYDIRDGIRLYLAAWSEARIGLDSNPSPENQAVYRDTVNGLFEVIQAIRNRFRLSQLDHAELFEIVLIGDCKLPQCRSAMGEELWTKLATFLADSDARDTCRRKTLALAWEEVKAVNARTDAKKDNYVRLGEYYLDGPRDVTLIATMKHALLAETVTTRLWTLLSKEPSAAQADREQLVALLFHSPGYSVPSDTTTYLRNLWNRFSHHPPASHWRGVWEDEAKALAKSIDTTPTGTPNGDRQP
jgi:hypothetical protein